MSRYDLFKTMPDGSPYWIGTADTLEKAKQMVERLGDGLQGKGYFVRDACDGVTMPLSAPPGKRPSTFSRVR
jgi:hypothetical protein